LPHPSLEYNISANIAAYRYAISAGALARHAGLQPGRGARRPIWLLGVRKTPLSGTISSVPFVNVFTNVRRDETLRASVLPGQGAHITIEARENLEGDDLAVPSSKRALKHEELRQRIYDAALTLFRREGVAGATIRAIAQEAGVGVGTFFNYFESKEGVLAELGRRRQQRLEALVADPALATLPTRMRVERMLGAMVEGMEEEPRLTRAVVRAALGSPTLFHGERGRFLTLTMLLAEMLREGQARGEVAADCDVAVASQLLISIYVTLTLDWTEGADEYALLPTLLAHVETLWRGVAPRFLPV
jgi:TetR/AcrR family transcriptional regulator, cholesterol catabolism regulator